MKKYNLLFSGLCSLRIWITVLSIALHATCMAQDIDQEYNAASEDSSRAPHGGLLQIAGNYFVECVNKDNKVAYYIYDINVRPISNKGITGKAVFKFQNKSAITISLTPQGLNGFSTGNRNLSDYITCEVTFTKEGKASKVEFARPSFNAIKYTCSLHPEIVQDKPGNCSRCGLALVEKKEMAKKNPDVKKE